MTRSRKAVWPLVLVLVAGLWWWGLPRWRAYLETLGAWYVKAAPLVVHDAAGQPMLATIVAQERPNWQRPTRHGYADDYVVELQLNHPDASDAGRIFVHRSSASVLNVAALGTDPDRVWLFFEGVRAIGISQRASVVDPAGLEARFPALRGQLSDDERHYEWRPSGLRLRTREGRSFDLDVTQWALAPTAEKTPVPQAKTHEEWLRQVAEYDRQVAVSFGPRTASRPGEHGLDSWRVGARWIGCLTDAAARDYGPAWAHPSTASLGEPERRRIWIADVSPRPVEHPMDEGSVMLTNLRPVGNKEYLRGAVLRDGALPVAVAIPNAPDVLIEHYTAIDGSGRAALTRVAPDGTERWTTTLPVAFPRTVAAIDGHVAITGFAPGVSDDRKLQLVSVRLEDGALGTYAFNP